MPLATSDMRLNSNGCLIHEKHLITTLITTMLGTLQLFIVITLTQCSDKHF